MDNVKVTLSLTPVAAEILHQYAGERRRGHFVSELLLAQRARDDAEGLRVAAEDAARIAAEAAEKAQKAAAASWAAHMPQKRRSRAQRPPRRRGGHK